MQFTLWLTMTPVMTMTPVDHPPILFTIKDVIPLVLSTPYGPQLRTKNCHVKIMNERYLIKQKVEVQKHLLVKVSWGFQYSFSDSFETHTTS